MFLKVGFILVKVHNPHEYVDIDIYAKFHVVFWFTCRYFKYNFALLVDILNIILLVDIPCGVLDNFSLDNPHIQSLYPYPHCGK